MARIELALSVFDDFDRFLVHMERFAVADPVSRIHDINQALQILGGSPLIGRRASRGRRELVIKVGLQHYKVRYRFDPSVDEVTILAVRNVRERSYRRKR